MNKFCTLAALAILTLGVAACDEKTETKVQEKSVVGGTEVETTATGTTTTDDEGNHSVEVEKEQTVDPEGLMNKETTTEEYKSETEH